MVHDLSNHKISDQLKIQTCFVIGYNCYRLSKISTTMAFQQTFFKQSTIVRKLDVFNFRIIRSKANEVDYLQALKSKKHIFSAYKKVHYQFVEKLERVVVGINRYVLLSDFNACKKECSSKMYFFTNLQRMRPDDK